MPAATLESLEQRLTAIEQKIAQIEQEHQPESAPKKKHSFRDRALAYMAEGPHLSPETAEQLRKDIYEAREEHLG